jgi:hypothetical protein
MGVGTGMGVGEDAGEANARRWWKSANAGRGWRSKRGPGW